MSAPSLKKNVLSLWNSISALSAMMPWVNVLALPLAFLVLSNSLFAVCSGCSKGTCSSGSGSFGTGAQSRDNYLGNQAGSSPYVEFTQNLVGASGLPPLPPRMGPHGGILSMLQHHQAEVIFTPQETRVYLYSSTGEPLVVGGVHGVVSMKTDGIAKIYRFVLRESSDARDRSFLLLRVNASQLRDGDMEATFELTGLPSRDEPRARFVQTFGLTQLAVITAKEIEKPKAIEVRQVGISAADRPLLEQQKICPVTKEPLGSMGGAVKLLVGGRPLLLCCEGCIEQVRNTPSAYLNDFEK